MRAAFTTVPRRGGVHYLGATLRSMTTADPLVSAVDIGVFSDSVEPPPDVPGWVHLECRTEEELAQVQAEQLVNGRNQIRVLRWVGGQQGGLVMTFEDDLEFTSEWLQRALMYAAPIPEYAAGQDFVLLLHHFERRALTEGFDPVWSNGKQTVWYVQKHQHTIGAQAMLMTPGAARRLADAMEAGIALEATLAGKQSWAIADQGVNHFCQSAPYNVFGHDYVGFGACPLYILTPCLVRHVGAVSAWSDELGAIPTRFFEGDEP